MDIFVYLTLCFTSLFTLMDPLGVMPVFLQMTDGMDTKERRYIALKACTIAFIILVLFTLSGRFLFHFFGISTNGFRIVGGIIIFKIGYDMLQAHFTHVKLNETERKEYSKDITITPLAIPMLCGPGAISSGITLMEDASEYTFKIVLLGVIALVCILSFFILCASTQLLKILGETVEAINLFAGTDIDIDEKEEVIDMCKAWEEQKNEGRELGREEGRIRQAKVTALKLQKKGHSIEDIAECVDFDEETVKKWLVS